VPMCKKSGRKRTEGDGLEHSHGSPKDSRKEDRFKKGRGRRMDGILGKDDKTTNGGGLKGRKKKSGRHVIASLRSKYVEEAGNA